MAKQKKTPIRYISLDSALCLMDPAFVSMSPAERGVYVSVVLHILAHGGSVPFDPIALTAVCNCADGEQFLSLWQSVRKNFVIRNHRLRNAWATRAITHARKARSRLPMGSRLKGAASGHASPAKGHPQAALEDATPIDNRQSKISRQERPAAENRKSDGIPRLPSGSYTNRVLIMAGHIRRHIPVRTPAERARFENVARWVVERIDSGQATEALAGKVEQAARLAASCDKPAARFIAAIRDELGYRPCDL